MTNKLLLDCRCGAKYDPRLHWSYGYYAGTSMCFTAFGSIEPGHCPICRRAPVHMLPPKIERQSLCM